MDREIKGKIGASRPVHNAKVLSKVDARALADKMPRIGRSDQWVNAVNGVGTGRDRTAHGMYVPDFPLFWTEIQSILRGDPIADKIANGVVKEAFREGYSLNSPDNAELAKETQAWADEENCIEENLMYAIIWGRAYGGSLLVFGADDGQNLDQPLNENRVKDVPWTYVVDRRYAYVTEYDTEPGPNFGRPLKYLVTVLTQMNSITFTVHYSRIIHFGGAVTDPVIKRANGGWDDSVLQRPYKALRDFNAVMNGALLMLSDASQGVFKIKNLIDMVAADDGSLMDRLIALDMGRGIARAICVDQDGEDFTKVATQFAGVPDMVDRFMNIASAASEGMPVSLLFGRSAAGMNATGDLDLETWFANVQSWRKQHLSRKVARAYRFMSLSRLSPTEGKPLDKLTVKWAPLRILSEKAQADARLVQAQTDQIHISTGMADPAALALARFNADGTYSFNAPEVDRDALEAELAAKPASFDVPDPGIIDPKAPLLGAKPLAPMPDTPDAPNAPTPI